MSNASSFISENDAPGFGATSADRGFNTFVSHNDNNAADLTQMERYVVAANRLQGQDKEWSYQELC